MTGDIHVGEGGRKNKKPRGQFVIALVVVVVLAAAGGVTLRWWQHQRLTGNEPPASPQSKEVTAAQSLVQKGDYDESLERIDRALSAPNISAQEKHDLYLQQGVVYENQKKYDKAMESYRKAESAKETLDAVQAIARLAEQKGDKTLAITYYKKAIPLIPEDDAMKDALKKYFENTIRVLEGKEPIYE